MAITKMKNKIVSIAIVLGLTLAAFIGVNVGKGLVPNGEFLSGKSTFSGPVDSIGGFQVNATSVISGAMVATFTTSTVESLIQGGVVCTITSASSTLSASQICSCGVIRHNAVAGGSTATQDTLGMASSSALFGSGACLQNPGDSKRFLLENTATSTMNVRLVEDWTYASTTIVFASTTGSALVPTIQYIQFGEKALIDVFNIDDTTTTVSVIPLR